MYIRLVLMRMEKFSHSAICKIDVRCVHVRIVSIFKFCYQFVTFLSDKLFSEINLRLLIIKYQFGMHLSYSVFFRIYFILQTQLFSWYNWWCENYNILGLFTILESNCKKKTYTAKVWNNKQNGGYY